MKRFFLAGIAGLLASTSLAALAQDSGSYHVINTVKVGGDGGFDYLYADPGARRLYIARGGAAPVGRIAVYDLDSLKPVGEIPGMSAHIVQIDPKSGHGFTSSKPVVMFDAKTLATIKTIDMQGNPDGMLYDPFNARVYVLSHIAPNLTVIDAASGTVLGTIDLGGAPEQAVSDGQGHLYVDIEDKDVVAVVDAKTMAVTGRYELGGKGGGPGALAIDAKNHILFVACHDPAAMVMLDAGTGKILGNLPIGPGVDEAAFDPGTMETFSSAGRRWHHDDHQGSKPNKLPGRGKCENGGWRTHHGAGHEKSPRLYGDRGVWSAARAQSRRRPRPRGRRGPMVPGFLHRSSRSANRAASCVAIAPSGFSWRLFAAPPDGPD